MPVRTSCISILLLISMTIFSCIFPGEVRAGVFNEGYYSIDTHAGYHYASVGGYRGKVGEYESLDSGMEGGFTLHSYSKGQYLDAAGVLRDEDDQRYLLTFDAGRIFETETFPPSPFMRISESLIKEATSRQPRSANAPSAM